MSIIDLVKWDDPGNLVVWKSDKSELTTMTQLIVNESQTAILFKNGQRCDLFGAGRHTLSTGNIPLLNKLINLPFGGKSPFAAEVWFVNHAVPLDLKFGTPTPLQLEDPVYQIVVPVRAFGQFGLQVEDPGLLVHKLVGTRLGMDQETLVGHFKGILISRLKSRIAQVIVREKIGVLEIETLLDDISRSLEEAYAPDFAEYGLAMRAFRIMSISVPEDDTSVQELKRAKAAAARRRIEGTNYAQERGFDVLQASASNEGAGGGFASLGVGLGMGQAMGQMGQALIGQQFQATSPFTPPSPAPPPFAPATVQFFVFLNGQQQGPFSIEQLRPGIITGAFSAQTPVWTSGLPGWLPAGQVPQLASLFMPTAPPPFQDPGGSPPPYGGEGLK
ncbi:MAG: SPFH domain-containing protein [Geothrix sp.]|uniref:SPFH domain-containing protein n=1 Tax=Geothrix sp. TaxID=1962974 RepID=UPI00185496C5|nr:SPFH domain-containing protein [Geothrix sp.]NWJ40692.1 SPFH domain-containing protein [Geothrix sp.]WIL21300.1 MAG: SPFH domain-containing protein [Geothrix sp.]